ncbi:MAG: hypothetical protein HN846_00585 [Candidatus Pacebacteria bacterium]|jgi:hypothetical protein|nr:hypothetical protein [Candidatus Paceibacterota bacterium]MBT3512269.1 hypothetical protein [Candidatus Paceibacterota bacterium]MBT4004781.1 hypothetical protein [Candidatus Paceibacterota bacterium]MBT4358709.1 hypothetical protein [Candidatus Paceibacterota bacterium]MBT4680988.1 hypothetical protein [Candidatus Paceibacterota bacterium]
MIEMEDVLNLSEEAIAEMEDTRLADFVRFIATCEPADIDELKEVNRIQDLINAALG